MKVDIKVKMKAEYIYDLLLFHTYSKLSGFLINLLGLTIIMAGGFLLKAGSLRFHQAMLNLALGFLVLCFTPVNLMLQARRMIRQPRYQSEIVYGFDDTGIEEHIGNTVNSYAWDQVNKVVSTPKNIAFYVQETSALILPKKNFGNNFMPVMKLIAGNMGRERIFIR